MTSLSQQDPRSRSFMGAFLLYYSSSTSYHSPASMGKRMSSMPRPSVAATSDSIRIHVRLRCVTARGGSLHDHLFISKDWKCRHRSLVERLIHCQRSQGLIPSLFNQIMNLRNRAQRQILQRTDMVSESSSSRMIRMLKVTMHKSTSTFEVGEVLICQNNP